MASKKLKAIAAQGDMEIGQARGPAFVKDALQAQKELLSNAFTPSLSKYGTPQLCAPMSMVGRFLTKNHQQGHFEFIDDISAETLVANHFVRRITCASCPIGCHHLVTVKEGKYAGSTNLVLSMSQWMLLVREFGTETFLRFCVLGSPWLWIFGLAGGLHVA